MTARRFSGRVVALLAALPWTAAPAASPVEGAKPLSGFPRERVVIETRSARRHVFHAWRADNFETRAQGLMFVTELRPDQAMIFVYDPPQPVSMWMKNTLLPLDMLFVDEAGCIVKLHARARPGSLATISANQPVVLVVEIAGGQAGDLGIDVGDRVTRPEVDWPRTGGPCSPAAR